MSAVRKAALDTGIVISNGTDADHDIDFAAGTEVLYNGSTYKYFTGTALAKQIDANWTEGDAAGGFPSGLSLTADTGYYLFMIGKADGTVDYGFDTSLTAANLLSDATGYTYYKAIWWVITDASSNIQAFTQVNGDTCRYTAQITDVEDSTGTAGTNQTGTISAPPISEVLINMYANNADTSGVTSYLNDLVVGYDTHYVQCSTLSLVDSNAQLRYKMISSAAYTQIALVTQAWRKKW